MRPLDPRRPAFLIALLVTTFALAIAGAEAQSSNGIEYRVRQLEASLTELRAQLNAQTPQLSSVQTQLSSLAALISPLQTQVSNQAGQISTLQAQLQAQAGVVVGLQQLLTHFSRQGSDIFITGANLHIVNGLGATNGNGGAPASVDPASIVVNGLGNLIVGYNESLQQQVARTGSHNVVVGAGHSYASTGSVVAGYSNTVSGPYATVTGGDRNMATGIAASVSGGSGNIAIGEASLANGGSLNRALGDYSTVVGGTDGFAELRLQTYMDGFSTVMTTLSNLLQRVSEVEAALSQT